jgi:hypothetical protein
VRLRGGGVERPKCTYGSVPHKSHVCHKILIFCSLLTHSRVAVNISRFVCRKKNRVAWSKIATTYMYVCTYTHTTEQSRKQGQKASTRLPKPSNRPPSPSTKITHFAPVQRRASFFLAFFPATHAVCPAEPPVLPDPPAHKNDRTYSPCYAQSSRSKLCM